MSSPSIYETSNVILDYELHRSGSIIREKEGTWLATFSAGSFFPILEGNDAVSGIVWDFGDGETITVGDSVYRPESQKISTELSRYVGFFPEWVPDLVQACNIATPKFRQVHRYLNAGEYKVKVTIITKTNKRYIGKETVVQIREEAEPYTVPEGWNNIASQYTLTDGVDLIFVDNRLPTLSTSLSSVLTIPAATNFILSDLQSRTDIDYIEWVFGDGSIHVQDVNGGIVTQDMLTITHTYNLMPEDLGYKPSVTVYIKKGENQKFKFVIRSLDILFRDRTNVGVAISNTGSEYKTAANYPTNGFNVTPTRSDVFPVETKFFVNITPDLKYVFWDHEDGTFDVTPIEYNSNEPFRQQVYIHTHTYTTISFDQYLPKAIFVYRDDNANGKYYTKLYRVRNFLRYDLGIFNRGIIGKPLIGIDGYSKFNGISVTPVYNDNLTADLHINLALSTPKQLYLFEKIIWEINGERIFHDRNTSKDFGYIVLRNVQAPNIGSRDIKSVSIVADLYGRPNVFSGGTNKELVFNRSFSFTYSLVSADAQEASISAGRETLSTEVVDFDPISVVTTIGNVITVVTPVITAVNTTPVNNFVTLLSNRVVFDKLFTADYPISNFLNRDHPSTVSTLDLSTTLSKYEIGYFTPAVCTPVIVEPGKFSFTVNTDALQFNEPYYFPDPFKYGSKTDALNFVSVDSSFKNSDVFSKAKNEPNTSEDLVPYSGYTSVKSIDNLHDIFDVVDKGYVYTMCDDIYNNKYALIKEDHFTQSIIQPTFEYIANKERDVFAIIPTVCLNGYRFYDPIFNAGYNFNYLLSGSYGGEVIVPGLSTYTGGFIVNTSRYTLRCGSFEQDRFSKSKEPYIIDSLYDKVSGFAYADGGVFALTDSISAIDTISSDLTSFPGSGSYYFSTVYEGGVHTANPYQRPTLSANGTPVSAANFTENIIVTLSSDYIDVDSGLFTTTVNNQGYFSTPIGTVKNDISPNSVTTYITNTTSDRGSYTIRRDQPGVVYVKTHSGSVKNLVDVFPYMSTKYISIFNQLSTAITNLDVKNDTLFIQLSNTLVIDKFKYENGKYGSTSSAIRQVNYNNDSFNKLSNRYSIDNTVFFTVLSGINTGVIGSQGIVPIIYKYNGGSTVLKQIYPQQHDLSSHVIPITSVLYTGCTTPNISYSLKSKTFDITTIVEDQNGSPSLLITSFKDNADNNIITNIQFIKLSDNNLTTKFQASSALSNFTVYLSSLPVNFNNNNLIL